MKRYWYNFKTIKRQMQKHKFAKISISISQTKQPVSHVRPSLPDLPTQNFSSQWNACHYNVEYSEFIILNQLLLFSTRHFAKLQHLVLLAPVSPNSSDLHSFLPGHLPQNLQQLGNYFEQLGNNFEQPGDNIEKIGNDNFFATRPTLCDSQYYSHYGCSKYINSDNNNENLDIYPFFKYS